MIWLDLAWSWLWAHWKGVLAVTALGVAWWSLDAYGDRREAQGRAAVQTAWDAAVLRQTQWAREREAADRAVVEASNARLRNAQAGIDARDLQLGLLADRVRELATRPRPVPGPSTDAECARALASERDRAAALGGLLAEGSDLARALGRERDEAVARLWEAAAAWSVRPQPAGP